MTLEFSVAYQTIKRTDENDVVAKSYDYLYAQFTFSTDEWNESDTKTAIFTVGNNNYRVVLDENNQCLVPWEVIVNSGYVYVSVFAGMLITVNKAKVYVAPTGYIADTTNSPDPTEDVYNQVIAHLDSIKDDAEDSAEAAAASATSASESESNAQTYAQEASESAQTATTKASEASASADSANSSAQTATTKAQEASESAQAASNSEQTASEKADVAESAASSAEESAENSEAYAVGKRNGVDVASGDVTYQNNSKYYSEQAASSAQEAYDLVAAAGYMHFDISDGHLYYIKNNVVDVEFSLNDDGHLEIGGLT